MPASDAVLTAPYTLAYPYKRSLGAVLSAFFTALRDGQLLGAKTSTGDVICPPTEYAPWTGEATRELVPVGPGGEVTAWTWVEQPGDKHPLDHPFAFALIRLEGATSTTLHVVDTGDERAMKTGMRVTALWATDRTGTMRDIAAFVPGDEALPVPDRPAHDEAKGPEKPVRKLITPIRLDYTIAAGVGQTVFLKALMQRKLLGSVDPESGEVYVPMRHSSPINGKRCLQTREVAHEGSVLTFCVVRIPFEGQRIPPPYVCAQVLLDGANTPLFHLVGGCDVDDVHTGMRVRAEWVEDDELAPTLESIKWFAPVAGEAGDA